MKYSSSDIAAGFNRPDNKEKVPEIERAAVFLEASHESKTPRSCITLEMRTQIRLASAVAALLGGLVTVTFAAEPAEPHKMRDERLYALARSDFKAFAHEVAKGATSELGQTQAIVRWLTQNFEWKTTDYQKRTVPEIVERGGGNCDDFSSVALAAMNELQIKSRKVHEVHIRTESPDRGARARALVKEKGNAYSVFGRHHNDHVYLEVYDSNTREWFPADPWGGLVGTDEWMKGRVWFGQRHSLNPDAEDMIVPIAIFAADDAGKFTIDRTKHYLIDEFDHLSGGKLHENPAWRRWITLLEAVSPKVKEAFAGAFDLHQDESEIDDLAAPYDRLRLLKLPTSRHFGDLRMISSGTIGQLPWSIFIV